MNTLMCSLNFQCLSTFRESCHIYKKKQPYNQAECDNGFEIDEVVEIREKLTFAVVKVHKPKIQNLESEMNNDGSTPIPDV